MEKFSLEIPGGMSDIGEDQYAATRELKEETGYVGKKVLEIGRVNLIPQLCLIILILINP